MKKIKLSTNITLNTVAIYIALFCVATYALMEHVSTTISAFSVVKMPLMYLGRVGPLTLAFALISRAEGGRINRVHFPEEKIMIG